MNWHYSIQETGQYIIDALRYLTFSKVFLLVLVALVIHSGAYAQQVENVDTAFQEARQLAFDGEYEEARSLARAILEISPNYHDVRILLARTFSWNGEYEQAREQLNLVLEKAPEYRDALSAAIDNALWAEKPEEAVTIGERAVDYHPVDETLLVKYAGALHAAEQDREVLRVLNQVDIINPSNSLARQLRRSIRISGLNYILTGSYTYDWFSEVFDPWQKAYIQLSRKTPIGSVIGRLNYGDRFGTTGIQPEIDIYPTIMDGLYGYVNVGFSNDAIFPEFRFGGELYKRLPKGYEISAGFRHLRFVSSNITIYTGSLSRYSGSWFFTVRPFFTPNNIGFSRSVNVLARRYFDGPENYFTFRSGFGFSPEERRFQNVSGNVFLVKSQYIGLDLFKSLRYNLAVFASFDVARQELRFDPGEYNRVYTLNGGIQVKF